MSPPLKFEWDEEKAAASAADIKGATFPFPSLSKPSTRPIVFSFRIRVEITAKPLLAFRRPTGVPLRVTYVVRGEVTRIISAHVMTKKERS